MLIVFCTVPLWSQSSIHSFRAFKMGTEFNIKVFGADSMIIHKAVQQAWARIDEINAVFSDYSSTSELAFIHHLGSDQAISLSPDFIYLLDISLKYSKLSNGAFDVSVGALSKIWRRAIKFNDIPDSIKIKEALQNVGYKKINFQHNKIRLPKGIYLDFGAIAKGYAVDQAFGVLKELGYPVCLIDGGGDIYAGLSPPNQSGWAINTTMKKGNLWSDSIVFIANASIVTSGDAYKYIEDPQGHRFSHIINPHTGYGIKGPHLTTVVAVNATHADALATTLSIMDESRMKRFKRKWGKIFPEISNNWNYKVYKP